MDDDYTFRTVHPLLIILLPDCVFDLPNHHDFHSQLGPHTVVPAHQHFVHASTLLTPDGSQQIADASTPHPTGQSTIAARISTTKLDAPPGHIHRLCVGESAVVWQLARGLVSGYRDRSALPSLVSKTTTITLPPTTTGRDLESIAILRRGPLPFSFDCRGRDEISLFPRSSLRIFNTDRVQATASPLAALPFDETRSSHH